jgi:hypothetical protein
MSGTDYNGTSTGMAGICSPGRRRLLLTNASRWSLAPVLVTLLLGWGCAHHRNAESTTPADDQILLVVENHHWNDVVVSVLHDGVVDRIGLVQAVKTSTLVIPARRLGPSPLIRLRAHAVGAPDDHTSESFPVRGGQEIEWTLESDLSRSSVAVH